MFSSVGYDIRLFTESVIGKPIIIGFIFGILFATLIIGFIITSNPRHIPTILRYSPYDGFQKIGHRATDGTYQTSFTEFMKHHTRVRMVTSAAITAFSILIIIALLDT